MTATPRPTRALRLRVALVAAVAAPTLTAGCRRMPGRPGPDSVEIRPDKVKSFDLLYAENCSGCHGPNGRGAGAAIGLANPVYLAIADDTVLSRATAAGVAGSLMPAFAKSSGGELTDEQIAILVAGIRAWARADALGGAVPPAYAGPRGRPGARRLRVRRIVRVLPRRRRRRRAEGRVDRRRIVPRPRERSGSADHGDRGEARHRPPRLAGRRVGRAPDGRTGHRRRRVARIDAAGESGSPYGRPRIVPGRTRE